MRPLALVLTVTAALLAPGIAHADGKRFTDPKDAGGPLDIASVTHGHSSSSVTHTIRTYCAFTSRQLASPNYAGLALEVQGASGGSSRLVLVFWYQGALRGVLADSKGNLLRLLPATHPDSRTLRVVIPQTALARDLVSYRWLAMTSYKSKTLCRATCRDAAPARPALHVLAAVKALKVVLSGRGLVRSTPGGIACPTRCSASFKQNATVTLTAEPTQDWVFTGWTGACTGTGPCVVKMSSAKGVGAVFTPTYLLTVTTAGPGDVRIEPPDVPCVGSCTQRYSPGATVTLTARTGPASAFEGWGGACSGTQPTCVVTMNSDTIVTARFTVRPFPLSAALEAQPGASGRHTAGPAGADRSLEQVRQGVVRTRALSELSRP
jgi:List-Bact-rpt repeat protein